MSFNKKTVLFIFEPAIPIIVCLGHLPIYSSFINMHSVYICQSVAYFLYFNPTKLHLSVNVDICHVMPYIAQHVSVLTESSAGTLQIQGIFLCLINIQPTYKITLLKCI